MIKSKPSWSFVVTDTKDIDVQRILDETPAEEQWVVLADKRSNPVALFIRQGFLFRVVDTLSRADYPVCDEPLSPSWGFGRTPLFRLDTDGRYRIDGYYGFKALLGWRCRSSDMDQSGKPFADNIKTLRRAQASLTKRKIPVRVYVASDIDTQVSGPGNVQNVPKNLIKGKVFHFTGHASDGLRLYGLVARHGGIVQSGPITDDVDYVVTGRHPFPDSVRAANSLGIPTITTAEFLVMVEEASKVTEADAPKNQVKGKVFCFTGKFFGSVDDIRSLLEKAGCWRSLYVGPRVDYLVIGQWQNRQQPKRIRRAEELGIPVITLDEFYQMMEKGGDQ